MAVDNKNGRPCVTVDVQKDRWRRHFNKVLNVVSVFDVCFESSEAEASSC